MHRTLDSEQRESAMRFFDSFASLGRTALTGFLAYAGLVLFLRLSGKRTLSKMNAFDFVVTVAIGSTLAAVLTSKRTPLADGLFALALLIVLQYGVARLAVRAAWFRRVIKDEPTLLFHRGRFLDEALHRERVVRDEVLAAVRGAGTEDLDRVEAVVLETDGSFSVLGRPEAAPQRSSLANVERSMETENGRPD